MRRKIHDEIDNNFKTSASDDSPSASPLKSTALVAEKEDSPGLIQAVAGTSIMMLLFAVASIGALVVG